MVFDNGLFVIRGLPARIPERPFEVAIDGRAMGKTKRLAFAWRVPDTDRSPQVLVLYASGYLRLKAGADPSPPLPFGQSLILGPAIWGSTTAFPHSRLFFNPQIQRVAIDTERNGRNGARRLSIRITGSRAALALQSTKTNRIMDLAWTLTLYTPNDLATRLDVAGTFEFTEDVTPDPVKTSRSESLRLLQISTMFIDARRHDVDALRFRSAEGVVLLSYAPALANRLLPAAPGALDPQTPTFDSLHTDALGRPNGKTPSYRIAIYAATGPLSGPATVRAFFDSGQRTSRDNLGLWVFCKPAAFIKAGTTGMIRYTVWASTVPLSA